MPRFFVFPVFMMLLATVFFSCKKNRNIAAEIEPDIVSVHTEPASPAQQQTGKDSIWVMYERTPCFGMCPYFNLKIYKNGYAVYEGKNFVDMIGFYHTTFDMTSLNKLVSTAHQINYFGLQDSYDNPRVTDLPTVTTGFWDGTKVKTVADRYKGPDELEEVYQLLDEMIQGAKWTALGN